MRTELGVDRVVVVNADTRVGSAGSSSASRQTYVTGGAIKAACELVRASLLKKIHDRLGGEIAGLRLADDQVWAQPDGSGGPDGPTAPVGPIAGFLGDDVITETVQWRHRPTAPIDPETGQGVAHVQYAFAAHRAVVDVDTDLGLVKVVATPRGRVLGGCSSINAMIYIRGNKHDYNTWRDEYGCDGWGYNDILPYFLRAELNSRGPSAYHGGSGPLSVVDPKYKSASTTAFVESASGVRRLTVIRPGASAGRMADL